MFERTRRGLKIAASSLELMRKHPRLLFLPILSVITLAASFFLIGAGMFAADRVGIPEPLLIPGLFALLLVNTFISVFFNVALVTCVMDAFAGRSVSLRVGLAAALARAPQISLWALYASTVGLLISFIQGMLRRFGLIGALLGNAASLSWAILTYFVVPILVTENVSPIQAVKRSTDIIKRNWGNAVGVEAGLSFLIIFAILPPVLLIAFVNSSAVTPSLHSAALVFAGIGVFAYAAVVIAFFSTMDVVFRTGVFLYATTGVAPEGTDPVTMNRVFRR